MKSISHYRGHIYRHFTIFGLVGLYYLLMASIFNLKWIVPVKKKWSPDQDIFLRLNSTDLLVFEQIFIEEEYAIINLLPETEGVIIDVGANIGLTSIYLRKKFPNAKIFSIEPDLSNFGLLCLNLSDISNVTPCNCAIWGDDIPCLFIPKNITRAWAKQTHRESTINSQEVRAMRMDEFMSTHSIEHVSILKMDVEGAEVNIFSKPPLRWLEKITSIIIELHDWMIPGCSEPFYESISGEYERIAETKELTLVARKSH